MSEIEDIRLDIETLRILIDVAIARGATPDDTLLRACENILVDRNARLKELQRVAAAGK